MVIAMPHAVIFDMDGLLFDTERIGLIAWHEAARAIGRTFDDDMLFEGIGRPDTYMESLIRSHVDPHIDFEGLYAVHDRIFREIVEHEGIPVKLGVYKLIDFLSRHDVVRALATSSDSSRTAFLLAQAGLEDAFDEIVTVDMVERGKPAPDLCLEACRLLEVAPSKALVLEDSAAGITAAHAGGIPSIWVPDLKAIPADVQMLASATIDSLEELRKVLSRSLVATPS